MFYCGGFGLFYCSEWRWGFCFRQWIWLAPPPTLPCSTGRWLRSRFCSRSLGCKLLSHMPGSRGSARDLSGVSTQNLKFLPSLTLPFLAPPLLLAVLVMLGSFYCFLSTSKMMFLLNFFCVCAAATMTILLLGKAANKNKHTSHRKPILSLSLPPTACLSLFSLQRLLRDVFVFVLFFLSRVYNYSLLADPLIKGPPSGL